MSLFSSPTPPDPARTPALKQVSAPLFAEFPAATPKVQILCPTPGAQIYFCQGAARPVPGEPGTRLYTGPLDVPKAGLAIRAAAFRPGMADSLVVRVDIEVEFFSKPEAVVSPVVMGFSSPAFLEATLEQLASDVVAAGITSETFSAVLRDEGIGMAQRMRARLLPQVGN